MPPLALAVWEGRGAGQPAMGRRGTGGVGGREPAVGDRMGWADPERTARGERERGLEDRERDQERNVRDSEIGIQK